MHLVHLFIYLLLPLAALLTGLRRKSIRWVSPAFLLVLTWNSALLGLILVLADPSAAAGEETFGMRSNWGWLPFGLAGISILLATLSFLISGSSNAPLPGRVGVNRWLLVSGGCGLGILGLGFTVTAIYAPQVLQGLPNPLVWGVAVFLVSITLACLLLYQGSRLNSAASPNLARWWAAGLSYFLLGQMPFLVSLCLVYASPGATDNNYSLLAVAANLGNLPLSILFFLLAKDYLPPNTAHHYKRF